MTNFKTIHQKGKIIKEKQKHNIKVKAWLSSLSTLSSLSSLLAKGFLGQTVWRPLRQIPDYKTPIWKTEYQNNGTDYHHHASYDDDDANYQMYNFLPQFPRLYFITPPVLKAFPGKLL